MNLLRGERNLDIYVNYEPSEKLGFRDLDAFKSSGKKADLIIVIGGDGTVIYAAKQFPSEMPPLLCFAMGSLGYLTNFKFKEYKEILSKLFAHLPSPPFIITERMRLSVTILKSDHRHLSGKAPKKLESKEHEEGGTHHASICYPQHWVVMNEVLLYRGMASMCNIDTFVDTDHLTTVQADGIIIATPTGSTAYSLSAGGSIVMPTIPAILFTPVCPHSLSFRPLLLHANTTLRLEVPLDARSTPSISFDGKDTMSLARGDAVEISRAPSPLLLFDHDGGLDFVNGLRTKLNWNVRENQKPFNHISSAIANKNNKRVWYQVQHPPDKGTGGGADRGTTPAPAPTTSTGAGTPPDPSRHHHDEAFDSMMRFIHMMRDSSGGVGRQYEERANGGSSAGWFQDQLDRLFEMHQGRENSATPAAKGTVERLNTRVVSKKDVEQKCACSVCLTEYELNEKIVVLPCTHAFHKDCLSPWLKDHNTCPVCRFKLPTDSDDAASGTRTRGSSSGRRNTRRRSARTRRSGRTPPWGMGSSFFQRGWRHVHPADDGDMGDEGPRRQRPRSEGSSSSNDPDLEEAIRRSLMTAEAAGGHTPSASAPPSASVSRPRTSGSEEDDPDLREAIRRSLEDAPGGTPDRRQRRRRRRTSGSGSSSGVNASNANSSSWTTAPLSWLQSWIPSAATDGSTPTTTTATTAATMDTDRVVVDLVDDDVHDDESAKVRDDDDDDRMHVFDGEEEEEEEEMKKEEIDDDGDIIMEGPPPGHFGSVQVVHVGNTPAISSCDSNTNEAKEDVLLRVWLPGGSHLSRSFDSSTTLAQLVTAICRSEEGRANEKLQGLYKEDLFAISLWQMYPRRRHFDLSKTIREVGLESLSQIGLGVDPSSHPFPH
eukprot:g4292.t1